MSYEDFKKSWDEEHSIKCPYCGEDYTNDSEFKEDLVTYHAEEPPQEKECGNCEKKFYVQEVVDRTWEVGKSIDKNGDVSPLAKVWTDVIIKSPEEIK